MLIYKKELKLVVCDGCDTIHSTEAKQFLIIVNEIKSDGWLIFRDWEDGQSWCHFCPECQGANRLKQSRQRKTMSSVLSTISALEDRVHALEQGAEKQLPSKMKQLISGTKRWFLGYG